MSISHTEAMTMRQKAEVENNADNTVLNGGGFDLLQNTSGTFTLNPPKGNIGQIVSIGAITEANCP